MTPNRVARFLANSVVVLASCLSVEAFAQQNSGGVWGDTWQGKDKTDPLWVNQSSAHGAREGAESLFQTLKSLDFHAPDVKEKLRSYGVESGQLQRALGDYEKQKRDEYFGQLNAPGASALETLREKGTQLQYLLAALAKGGPIAILESYFFSFLLDSQGFSQEANYFFNRAEFMKKLVREHRLTELVRPLELERPRIFESLELPRMSEYEMEIVPFADDEMIKEEGYLIQNGLDSAGTRLTVGGFVQYDSNVYSLADRDDLAANSSHGGSVNQLVAAELGAQTSAAKIAQIGASLLTFLNHHVREDTRLDDAWTAAPSVFVSAWNGSNNELRARYDYLYTYKMEQAPHVFSRIQGPQASWAHSWHRRFQGELLYSYTSFDYMSDPYGSDQQTGPEHALTAKFAYPGENARIQPYTAYRFSHHFAKGSNFQSNGHWVELGTAYLLGENTVLNVSTDISLAFYPNSAAERSDRLHSVRLSVMHRLFEQLTLTLDASYIDNVSSSPELFSYSHWSILGGAVVTGWL